MQITRDQLSRWREDPVTLAFLESLKSQIEFKKEAWLYDGFETERESFIAMGMAQAFEVICADTDQNEIYSFAVEEEQDDK